MRICFIILCLSVSAPMIDASPTPTPTPTSHIERRETRKTNSLSNDNSAIAQPRVSPLNQEPTDNEAQNQQNSRPKDSIKSPFGWGTDTWIAIFTFFLAVLAGCQFWAMHRQARFMREALAETKKAADAATMSAKTAKDALHLCERADVLIYKVTASKPATYGSPNLGPTSVVTITFKNYGRTRAMHLTATCYLEIYSLEQTEPLKISKPAVGVPMVLGAGDTFEVKFPPIGEWLDDDTVRQIIVRPIMLWFKAEINYKDVFDIERPTVGYGDFDPAEGEFAIYYRQAR
jgi:hypothetical protein